MRRTLCSAILLLATLDTAGCRRPAPVATLEQKADQARARRGERERLRAELEQIPPPAKSRYIDVHNPDSWENPFLVVGVDTVSIRVIQPDANPSSFGQGGMLRPMAARRQEVEVQPARLADALAALPANTWPYGRVVAVAEMQNEDPRQRPAVRRNVEATIQALTDLGVVVDEWPAR
jgi:hypothetical protein